MKLTRPPKLAPVFLKNKRDSWESYKTDHPNKQVLLKYEVASHYRGLGKDVCNFLNRLKDDLNALMYGEERFEYYPPKRVKNHLGETDIQYEDTRKMTKSEIADLRNSVISQSENLWEEVSGMTQDLDYHVESLDGYEKAADNIVKMKSEGTND